MSTSRRPFFIIGIVALVVFVGALMLLKRETTRSFDQAPRENVEGSGNDARNPRISTNSDRSPRTSGSGKLDGLPTNGLSTSEAVTLSEEPPERTQDYPFNHLNIEFKDYKTRADAEGYRMDGIVQDVNGISLAPADEETTDGEFQPRIGTMESPSLPLAQSSNAVAPSWKIVLPEGTSIQVEISLSPDQESWSQWHPVEPTGDEIEPNFPDGRPNPSYGFITGTMIANGLDLFPYVKYRVTLASSVGESPVLSEFKLFHVDSTDGLGVLAEINTPGSAPPPTPGQ